MPPHRPAPARVNFGSTSEPTAIDRDNLWFTSPGVLDAELNSEFDETRPTGSESNPDRLDRAARRHLV